MSKANFNQEMFKEAIRLGSIYVQKRGLPPLSDNDSLDYKTQVIYQQLVRDQLIQPLAKADLSMPKLKQKLAIWIEKTKQTKN